MSLALQIQFGRALWSWRGQVVLQLLEMSKLVHRSGILAAQWGLGRTDATDRA